MLRSLVFALSLPTLLLPQTTSPLRQLSSLIQEVTARVDPAVVQVLTRGLAPAEGGSPGAVRAQRGNGSGVIVDPDGYIITNAHVIGATRRVEVLVPQKADAKMPRSSILKPAGKLVQARVLGLDRETDIAVLKIEEKGLAHLPLADSEAVRQGEVVLAFGSPFGLENSVSMGVVSSVARQLAPDHPMIYIQTDAAINPGNSGGPLVDADGRVIGINTFLITQSGGHEGIGFAAPSNIVRTVYEQIRREGRVRRGQVGMILQTISPALAQALDLKQDWGVLVEDVRPGGAAEAAGLALKDILLTLDGKPLENARQFGVGIYSRAGQTVTLEVLRGERRLTLSVAVLERPQDPDDLLSLATSESNAIPQLGIIGLTLDAKVSPRLPDLRRLSGVVVAGVLNPGGARPEDAFHAADVIYAINNTPVSDLDSLKTALAPFRHGQPIAVQVERKGQLQFLLVEVE